MRRFILFGFAALLAWREVAHLSEPFLHNRIDTFLDVAFGASIVLLVANGFGVKHPSWAASFGPLFSALILISVASWFRWYRTPGYRLAEWAEQSPWRGFRPAKFFIDVDPWLILASDLLIFTAACSFVMGIGVLMRARRESHAKAI